MTLHIDTIRPHANGESWVLRYICVETIDDEQVLLAETLLVKDTLDGVQKTIEIA